MSDPVALQEMPLPDASRPILAEAPAGRANDLHELRVRIPVDLHRQLLSLKILRGRSLAETVAIALDIYFAERESGGESEGAARA